MPAHRNPQHHAVRVTVACKACRAEVEPKNLVRHARACLAKQDAEQEARDDWLRNLREEERAERRKKRVARRPASRRSPSPELHRHGVDDFMQVIEEEIQESHMREVEPVDDFDMPDEDRAHGDRVGNDINTINTVTISAYTHTIIAGKRPLTLCIRRVPRPPRDLLPEGAMGVVAGAAGRKRYDPNLPIRSTVNQFGLFREYVRLPDTFAEQGLASLAELWEAPSAARTPADVDIDIWPFPNLSALRFAHWFWNLGDQKTDEDRQRLLQDVLFAPGFNLEAIRKVPFKEIEAKLASIEKGSILSKDNGWMEDSVPIRVPLGDDSLNGETEAIYTVPGFYHRSIPDVVGTIFEEGPIVGDLMMTPYKLFWQDPAAPPSAPPQRVFDEVIDSDAMHEAHTELQASEPIEGCPFPRVVAAMMGWSDATCLTNFGTASLWPLYMYPAHLSKYVRGRPSAQAAQHMAFFPKLPADFEEFVRSRTGKAARPDVIRHCNRELLHACLRIMMDEAFMIANKYGIVRKCYDGIWRRLFVRLFTWSADYIEKTSLVCIKDGGTHPCPFCLIEKKDIHRLGMVSDRAARERLARVDDKPFRDDVRRARRWIYERGYLVEGAAVKRLLDGRSLTAVLSAFSEKLGPRGVNSFKLLKSDMLHEFELGEWKAFLTHLIRILHSLGPLAVQTFNTRFRQVATFGRDTIRRFPQRVADLSHFAARDYEDVLQCIMPCVEGLIGDTRLEAQIMDSIWELATWHGLAKLRIHTEHTLTLLDNSTTTLGAELRRFQKHTCPQFETRETPKEQGSRLRREAKAAAAAAPVPEAAPTGPGAQHEMPPTEENADPESSPPPRPLARKRTTRPVVAEPSRAKKTRKEAPQTRKDVPKSRKGTSSAAVAAPTVQQQQPPPPKAKTQRKPKGPKAQQGQKKKKAGKRKSYSLSTVKHHLLGYYVAHIRRHGTTDNYSTATGELEHRKSKSRYRRGPRLAYTRAIAKMDQKQNAIRRLTIKAQLKFKRASSRLPVDDPLPYTTPEVHHHIAIDERNRVYIPHWLAENRDDPAFKGFLPMLQDHLLARLQGRVYDEDAPQYTSEDRRAVIITHNYLYFHAICRVNYTTYNLKRNQDSINPRGRADILVKSNETTEDGSTPHPFWYGRVVGVFHVNVLYNGDETRAPVVEKQRMEILWVRWFGRDLSYKSGWKHRRLDRVGFIPFDNPNGLEPFGFVDPADVIRGCHIIPAFAYGLTEELLPNSALTPPEGDFTWYYISRFVDRDMLMRYLGGGIGHANTGAAVATPCETTTDLPTNEGEAEEEAAEDVELDNVDEAEEETDSDSSGSENGDEDAEEDDEEEEELEW